jgi:hypothetical protein
MTERTCTRKGCLGKHRAKGLCAKHYLKVYNRKNKAKISKQVRAYYESNVTDIKAYSKRWQGETLDGRWSHFKAQAKARKQKMLLTKEEFADITTKRCSYCGDFSKDKICVGVDRIDSAQGYHAGNVVPCCEMCNLMKRHYDVDAWVAHLKKVISFIHSGGKVTA